MTLNNAKTEILNRYNYSFGETRNNGKLSDKYVAHTIGYIRGMASVYADMLNDEDSYELTEYVHELVEKALELAE